MTNPTNVELNNIIEQILVKHSSMKSEEGRFQVDVYIDHDNTLSATDLKAIFSAEDKMDAFYDALFEFAQESNSHAEDDILDILKHNWPTDAALSYADSYDEILEYLGEHVDYNFPYDHFLKQNLSINFMIDTGDGNYDYVLNNFASYNASENEKIDDESSLLWLVKQQGYKKSDLNRLVRKGETKDSAFLESVLTEARNVTSHMNALTFFVKMTVEEYIHFQDKGKTITFSKETPCGLYDCWNGAGGMLSIKLEKDVIVPAKFAQPHIEGTRGYGIDNIYGMYSSFWQETVLNIKSA